MESKKKDFKATVKTKLREIKECNLDIAILRRRLDQFSSQNFIERDNKRYTIEDLTENIKTLEDELEKELIASKETKIDTLVGLASFRDMPDSWTFDVPKIMDFLKTLPEKIAKKFIRVTTTLLEGELKKTIIADNNPIFEKGKIVNLDSKLYLVDEELDESYEVKGIEIKRQDPRFHYKIKSNI